ncbi:MAG: TetR/AcrR family transcriptional regulator [Clostridium sp.]|uniref:TetR/AcrR family transcriptional regulator n=1 Tax=Butyribacter sp. TaxID=2822465 RepID=UPI002A9D4828|nr:TetR/AcrR family transcriptional regulator [Clostridium sp.]MDY5181227.1 TetR/AcrR family transcriptional regulator [Butyribacter sp.]
MPKETFYRLPDEKRERIMAAAEREFLENSFEAASINHIIKEAAIPRGSFYQYFEDKKDIFLYIVNTHKNEAFGFVESFIKDSDGDVFSFMRKVIDFMISAECSEKVEGMKRIFSQPWVFDMIVSDTMKGKQEEANTPKGIMFKYIDKNQLNVENDDELIALINIFASISLGLFFKIFIMGKNVEIDKEKIRKTIYDEIATLEKKYKK